MCRITIANPLKRAFSLIELIVVIAISGLIIAIAIPSYTTAQRQARDTRRVQDIKRIQAAMEQFYAIHSYYPSSSAGNLTLAFEGNSLPVDPKSGSYTFSNTSTSEYCICAALEAATGNANPVATTTCTWNAAGTSYCVQHQQ
ncbi:MAG: prepilin-type N-terminal cleavage/methylation domain-containing protein [bacterium]